MFICAKCKELSLPGETSVQVVVETRDVVYPERPQAMRAGKGFARHWVKDPGGIGKETVREEQRHEKCSN